MSGTKWVIFREAAALFARSGYTAVSMKQIAQAAGIRTSSIYNHFPSKDALLQEMYRYYSHHANQMLPHLEDLLDQLGTHPPREVFRRIVYVFPKELESLLYSILAIAATNTWDSRAEQLLQETFFDHPIRYTTTLLHRMLELDLIEPIDVEAFAANYSAIQYSSTLQLLAGHPISLDLWQRTFDLLFEHVVEKPRP